MSNDDQYWENQSTLRRMVSATLFFTYCIKTAVGFELGKHVTNCKNCLVIRCPTLQHMPDK